jgi:hypothetical protein
MKNFRLEMNNYSYIREGLTSLMSVLRAQTYCPISWGTCEEILNVPKSVTEGG